MSGQWARPLRVTYPDGFVLDGVQFPSGRCVLDCDCRDTPAALGTTADRLVEAATSFEHLTSIKPLAVVEWADGQTETVRVEWADGGQP